MLALITLEKRVVRTPAALFAVQVDRVRTDALLQVLHPAGADVDDSRTAAGHAADEEDAQPAGAGIVDGRDEIENRVGVALLHEGPVAFSWNELKALAVFAIYSFVWLVCSISNKTYGLWQCRAANRSCGSHRICQRSRCRIHLQGVGRRVVRMRSGYTNDPSNDH